MAEREFANEIVSALKLKLDQSQRSTRAKTLLSWFETPEGRTVLVSLEDKIAQLLRESTKELTADEIIRVFGWGAERDA
jgi:hypothetical protein